MPYGWQFRDEDVYIPCERGFQLNIFGMIDRRNRYEGFTTTENMTADKVAVFLDRMSLCTSKKSLITQAYTDAGLCGNFAPYGRSGGLFLFFFPPYRPHLNIAETLWCILKGKWLRPVDYLSTDALLYATNRTLAAIGAGLKINFNHVA